MTTDWKTMESAPRDGSQILGCIADTDIIHVCYPKRFPKPIADMKNRKRGKDHEILEAEPGDTWEYFRDEVHALGHTWSFVPTHWMPLPEVPVQARTLSGREGAK